jgi:hypothetical protein
MFSSTNNDARGGADVIPSYLPALPLAWGAGNISVSNHDGVLWYWAKHPQPFNPDFLPPWVARIKRLTRKPVIDKTQ